jgi:hypothetical protein
MSNNTNRNDLFETPTLFIQRRDEIMGKPGCYRVTAKNIELAAAQGVGYGSIHFNAVVDDFGNLVRVTA